MNIINFIKNLFHVGVEDILADFHKAVTALEKVAQREEAKAATYLGLHEKASVEATVASGVAKNIKAIITPAVGA